MPLAGYKDILKGTDGKFIAHAADIVRHCAVASFLIGQLQVEVGHLFDVQVGAEENEAFLALKDFMYRTVYVDRSAKKEEQKVDICSMWVR